MKASSLKPWLFAWLAAQALLVSGCTSVLWQDNTFAHHYRPADPVNLHVFYSEQRKDLLVQYDELENDIREGQPRFYWLDPNLQRVNREQKPRFVLPAATNGLAQLPTCEFLTIQTPVESEELYAVAQHGDDSFMLYSGQKKIDEIRLPIYSADRSQKVKQVLLTPLALAADATLVGGVVAVMIGPQWLQLLNK